MFAKIEDAIKDIKRGKMIIIVDDENRENEGDICMAAEKITPQAINFMARFGRGLICVPMLGSQLNKLKIYPMVSSSEEKMKTAFMVSVDAKNGITTGISAHDRYLTIKKLVQGRARSSDFVKPGHIFPLRYREGGTLVRAGHTEAIVDLAKLSGLYPAGVICEIMNDDGTMARLPELIQFAKANNLKIVTIADLIQYRRKNDTLVKMVSSTAVPTPYGTFIVYCYENLIDKRHHLVLVKGKINPQEPVLVRVHSECLTGDVFKSKRCDCGDQLEKALKIISNNEKGIILYMREEGRGIGLLNKIRAYELQDDGRDTVEANEELGFPADLRDYGCGAQILCDLGVKKIKLLTNNPRKIVALQGYNLEIVERIPLEIPPNEVNVDYLKTKKEKLGHLLEKVK